MTFYALYHCKTKRSHLKENCLNLRLILTVHFNLMYKLSIFVCHTICLYIFLIFISVQTASGGIIALIVIIVLVIIIAAAVGIWYLWKRKKKKSARYNVCRRLFFYIFLTLNIHY